MGSMCAGAQVMRRGVMLSPVRIWPNDNFTARVTEPLRSGANMGVMKHALIALLLVALPVPAFAETVSGGADVVDGDTLVIEGRHVRLFGIDAPETAQTCERNGETWACGEESVRQLTQLIGTQPVTCRGSEVDQYSRLLAVCHAGRFELNRTLVQHGWATAFHSYSDAYAADETRAKTNRLTAAINSCGRSSSPKPSSESSNCQGPSGLPMRSSGSSGSSSLRGFGVAAR